MSALKPRRRKKNRINLLPEEGFASTTTGRILLWILSTFRIIVIITEIIVMVAFLSRFYLDVQNSDLNEEIKQKSAVIAASADFEEDFRDTQQRLKIYSGMVENEHLASDSIKKIVENMPNDVVLESINLNNEGTTLNGIAANERSVQQFVINMEENANLGEVSVQSLSINKQNESLIDFKLNINS